MHRINTVRGSSVYAHRQEIDAWLLEKDKQDLEISSSGRGRFRAAKWRLLAAGALCLALAGGWSGWFLLKGRQVLESEAAPIKGSLVNIPVGSHGVLFSEDQAVAAGVASPVSTNGSSIADIDGDGFEDLILVGTTINQRVLVIYRNQGDGTFRDATAEWSGIGPFDPGQALLFSSNVDFDNDGDLDLLLGFGRWAGPGGELRFLCNNHIGAERHSFTLVRSFNWAQIPTLAAWGDFDNDGDLDIFVDRSGAKGAPDQSPVLLKNNLVETGSLSFSDVSVPAKLLTSSCESQSVQWIDIDNDGDLDLLVVNNFEFGAVNRSLLYQNQLKELGQPVFREIAESVGLIDAGIPTACANFGDFDNDGDQDIYYGVGHSLPNLLFRNSLETGTLGFSESAASLKIQWPPDGGISLWGDIDNDNDLDLLAGGNSGDAWVLYRNLLIEKQKAEFWDITEAAGLIPGDHQSAMFLFDMDNDGDLDIFSGSNGRFFNRLFRNNLAAGNWLEVKLVGTTSNRDGIGARLVLEGGASVRQRQHTLVAGPAGNQSHRIHFGTGDAQELLTLTVYWPSGIVQSLHNIRANQILLITEPAPGILSY